MRNPTRTRTRLEVQATYILQSYSPSTEEIYLMVDFSPLVFTDTEIFLIFMCKKKNETSKRRDYELLFLFLRSLASRFGSFEELASSTVMRRR